MSMFYFIFPCSEPTRISRAYLDEVIRYIDSVGGDNKHNWGGDGLKWQGNNDTMAGDGDEGDSGARCEQRPPANLPQELSNTRNNDISASIAAVDPTHPNYSNYLIQYTLQHIITKREQLQFQQQQYKQQNNGSTVQSKLQKLSAEHQTSTSHPQNTFNLLNATMIQTHNTTDSPHQSLCDDQYQNSGIQHRTPGKQHQSTPSHQQTVNNMEQTTAMDLQQEVTNKGQQEAEVTKQCATASGTVSGINMSSNARASEARAQFSYEEKDECTAQVKQKSYPDHEVNSSKNEIDKEEELIPLHDAAMILLEKLTLLSCKLIF